MTVTGAHGNEVVEVRMQKFIYTVWSIWKERCRRVYDNKGLQPNVLVNAIQMDVQQWSYAWNRVAGSLVAGLIGEVKVVSGLVFPFFTFVTTM
jgi:hypothetical protein